MARGASDNLHTTNRGRGCRGGRLVWSVHFSSDLDARRLYPKISYRFGDTVLSQPANVNDNFTYLWQSGGTECPSPSPGVTRGLFVDLSILSTDDSGNGLTWRCHIEHGMLLAAKKMCCFSIISRLTFARGRTLRSLSALSKGRER